ncbi:Bacterial transcription activator, effector binding domain [Poriferisphaera corsica]|uniref:Bacterial transcription activator, effector binding domain n=1 Tax=Poriferisphaera corsica TaxID=2528020 RepID=A0A517YQ62_9BACT|nr:Bacterial transcription activator, effector binding domain [Poriferisphaera corsica]
MSATFNIKQESHRLAIAISYAVQPHQIRSLNLPIHELYTFAQKRKLTVIAPLTIQYSCSPNKAIHTNVCLPIDSIPSQLKLETQINQYQLAAATFLTHHHIGPVATIPTSWKLLIAFARSSSHKTDTTCRREVYHHFTRHHAHDNIIELQLTMAKQSTHYTPCDSSKERECHV